MQEKINSSKAEFSRSLWVYFCDQLDMDHSASIRHAMAEVNQEMKHLLYYNLGQSLTEIQKEQLYDSK